jgi:beta-galactosidase
VAAKLESNGQPVKLKGVCLHQDAGCRGTAVKQEIWRERLESLKEMGCNALRPSHHTFSGEFMDLCDEMGFYVYEECFDKWRGGLYGRYFDTEWQRDVEAMVKRDRNRPSIVIWGVGNEVENQAHASMLEMLDLLTSHVRSLDPSRPVCYAMNPHFKRESNVDLSKIKDIQKFVDEVDDKEIYDPHERVERIKRIAKYVDIICCNYSEQWYELIHDAIPDKPILGTEVYPFFHGHMEQMQNYTAKMPSLVPQEHPFVIGGMIWTGYDYFGESMGYPAKGWGGAVIRSNGERRASYYMLQSYWMEKPIVHFSVLDYSLGDEGVKEHWDIPPYVDHWCFPQFHKTVIPYMIATNCDEVALFLNGKHYHLPKPEDCLNGIVTGFLPYQPGTVGVVGYRGGVEVCREITRTPGQAVKLEFDCPERTIKVEDGYELLLTVRAKDEEGVPCFRENVLVRFRVEGGAEILGVDAGNLMGNEPLCETAIHLYRGCASMQIRLGGKPGRVCVFADGDGMFTGQATIQIL